MWASALTAFELLDVDPSHWEEAFKAHPLKAPEPTQRTSRGFVLNTEGVFCDSLGGRHAFLVGIARRNLPKDAVEREVRLRGAVAAALEKDKPSWADVELDMLPGAPIREDRVPVIFDEASGNLLVFASAAIAGDFVLPAMLDALGAYRASPWTPARPLQALATEWVRTGELPLPFSLGEDVELETADGEGKVRVTRQDIREQTVLALLEAGRVVKSLEVRWGAKLNFRINTKGDLRRVGPANCKLKPLQAFEMWPDIVDDLFAFVSDVDTLTGGEYREKSPAEEDPAEPTNQASPQAGHNAGVLPATESAPSSAAAAGPAAAPRQPPALVVVGEQGSGSVLEFLQRTQAKRPWGEIWVHAANEGLLEQLSDWGRAHGNAVSAVETPDLARVRGVAVIGPGPGNEPLIAAARAAGVPLVVQRAG